MQKPHPLRAANEAAHRVPARKDRRLDQGAAKAQAGRAADRGYEKRARRDERTLEEGR